ncbi:hypothetical protein [Streptomyces sp. NPDC059651]|uniref:hypothetical protein n=1 Tax=Streptomyces sp. NPDC059651 TaxID=3346897 RepID=UPI0036A138C1
MSNAPKFKEQAGQFSALRHLVEKYPDLPSGYVICHGITSGSISLLLDRLAEFEAWREALGVPPEGVNLVTHGRQHSVEILLPVGDVVVRLWTVAEMLTVEVAA